MDTVNGATVTVVGNLTRDPELRFTAGGQAVTRISLAHNRKWTNRATGRQEEATSYFNVTVWGDLGEHAAETLGKGDRAIVFGRLDQRRWQDDRGDNRSAVDIVAEAIGLDLRYATATVQRTERPAEGPTPQAAPTPQAPAEAARPAPNFWDEEPF